MDQEDKQDNNTSYVLGGLMEHDEPRKILDAYLQGAHLALFAVQGKVKGQTTVPAEELEAVLTELHDVFADARRALRTEAAVVAAPRGITPFPFGKN